MAHSHVLPAVPAVEHVSHPRGSRTGQGERTPLGTCTGPEFPSTVGQQFIKTRVTYFGQREPHGAILVLVQKREQF